MKPYLIFLVISLSAPIAFAKQATDFMDRNVNTVTKGYAYRGDFDSAKFRLQVYRAPLQKMTSALEKNPSKLCSTARSPGRFSKRSSSHYVLSVLKTAGAVPSKDKTYAFKSAHFFWEYYLTFRSFVDVSRSFKNLRAEEVFKSIPEGYILQVQKHCVPNGAVAVVCEDGLYTTRFPDFENLKKKIDDPAYPKCKISRGVKLIVEAKRLRGEF